MMEILLKIFPNTWKIILRTKCRHILEWQTGGHKPILNSFLFMCIQTSLLKIEILKLTQKNIKS